MAMDTVTSADGTTLAYDRQGTGPALILVDGALTTRASGSKQQLAALLAPHFTTYLYDRRGRGDSADTPPYSVAREIDDIAAMIDEAGGTASLYGHSSGACLALLAAERLTSVNALALYEAPYNDAPEAQQAWGVYIDRLTAALAENRRGDAVALFMQYVGIPDAQIEAMRQAPFWSGYEAVAPTLAYDHTGIMGKSGAIPNDLIARVTVPVLVMHGDAGLAFMAVTAEALGRLLAHAQVRTLAGQTHNVQPDVLAPVVADFLESVAASR
jgi:pimeloyl-ACP methyl ester carboxylesterase